MNHEEIKRAVLKRLRKLAEDPGPPPTAVGAIQGASPSIAEFRDIEPALNRGLEILAVFWELVAAGVIVPGKIGVLNGVGTQYKISVGGADAYAFPTFSITEFGRRVLLHDDVVPLEASEYVESVKKRLPNASDVITQYVGEAVASFADSRYLASSVLLGVAAEEVARMLYAALARHLSGQSAKSYNEAMIKARGSAHQQFEEFNKRVQRHLSEIPEELRRRLEAHLTVLVGLLKITRDDVGHARPARVDREIAYLNLTAFPVMAGIVAEAERTLLTPCTIGEQ